MLKNICKVSKILFTITFGICIFGISDVEALQWPDIPIVYTEEETVYRGLLISGEAEQSSFYKCAEELITNNTIPVESVNTGSQVFHYVSMEELMKITSFSCINKNVSELDFLKYLRNLTNLEVAHCKNIGTIDISYNTGLKKFIYNGGTAPGYPKGAGTLQNVVFSQNGFKPTLNELSMINSNSLTSIDLSSQIGLTKLNLSRNNLETIDLSKNVNLKDLNLSNNQLTSIDLTNLSKLETVDLTYNKLTEIDITQNENITDTEFEGNTGAVIKKNEETVIKQGTTDDTQKIVEVKGEEVAGDSNKKGSQTVDVKDTLKTAYVGYCIGSITLILGIMIIYQTYRKSKKEIEIVE